MVIVPVEEKRRWSETCMPDDVLNILNLEAGGVVRMNLPNVGRLLEYWPIGFMVVSAVDLLRVWETLYSLMSFPLLVQFGKGTHSGVLYCL